MMMLKWFHAREAADVGAALADQFAAAAAPRPHPSAAPRECERSTSTALQELHERADREVRTLELNFYQKARFANSFKWRLIENGVEAGRGRRRDSVSVSAPLSGTGGRSDGPRLGRPRRAWAQTPARPALCLRVPRRPSRRAIMPKPWTFLMSMCRLSLAERTL